MENFNQLVADGVHREVLHPNLGVKWTSMWDRFDLGAACKQINHSAYPHELRSAESFSKAVENMLRFSTYVRQEWTWFAEIFCRHATGFVDSSWMLQFGALTHPCFLAQGLKDIETHTSKSALVAKPTHARTLRDFLVAELLAGNGLRKTEKMTPPSEPLQKKVDDLNFDLSEDENSGTAAASGHLVDLTPLTAAWRALEGFNGRKRKHGSTVPEKMTTFKKLYDEVVEEWKKVPAPDASTVVTFADLKMTAKKKKDEVKALG